MAIPVEPHKVNYFNATIEHIQSDHVTLRRKVLLTNITTSNGVFRDHAWINLSKRVAKVTVGTTIAFSAIVTPYLSQGEEKLGLRHLRNVIAVTQNI